MRLEAAAGCNRQTARYLENVVQFYFDELTLPVSHLLLQRTVPGVVSVDPQAVQRFQSTCTYQYLHIFLLLRFWISIMLQELVAQRCTQPASAYDWSEWAEQLTQDVHSDTYLARGCNPALHRASFIEAGLTRRNHLYSRQIDHFEANWLPGQLSLDGPSKTKTTSRGPIPTKA